MNLSLNDNIIICLKEFKIDHSNFITTRNKLASEICIKELSIFKAKYKHEIKIQ
jgi:hypothetical protein